MLYNIKIGDGNRADVINYIHMQKQINPNYRVVDVGGAHGGWSAPYVDAIVDFNDIPLNSSIKHFKCDITNPNDYSELMTHVEQNGKYDFCICTHTLEDIMNPAFVCEQIEKISKEGYIAFPSKHRELARIEGYYRGYIHHRWIFIPKEDYILSFPKINYIEDPIFNKVANAANNVCDLSFYWKDRIKIKYVNNNYLGPNVSAVISYYNELLQ